MSDHNETGEGVVVRGDDHNNEGRRAPAWMSKHPCEACGTGYGMCAQTLAMNLMCCKGCSHPTRWGSDPWTADEMEEMWEGKNPPAMVLREIARLRGEAE